MTRKVCSKPRCPVLVDSSAYRGLCTTHQRDRDRERGSRAERGYGPAHQAARAGLVAALDRGERVTCWRCDEPIESSIDLHLGHDNQDRSITRGPEHVLCNLRAAGKARHTS